MPALARNLERFQVKPVCQSSPEKRSAIRGTVATDCAKAGSGYKNRLPHYGHG